MLLFQSLVRGQKASQTVELIAANIKKNKKKNWSTKEIQFVISPLKENEIKTKGEV